MQGFLLSKSHFCPRSLSLQANPCGVWKVSMRVRLNIPSLSRETSTAAYWSPNANPEPWGKYFASPPGPEEEVTPEGVERAEATPLAAGGPRGVLRKLPPEVPEAGLAVFADTGRNEPGDGTSGRSLVVAMPLRTRSS